MALIDRLQKALGWPDPPAPEPVAQAEAAPAPRAPEPPELPVEPSAHQRALAKAGRDVRRFTLAIEQCQKGEARLRVLRDDLTRAERRLTMLGEL